MIEHHDVVIVGGGHGGAQAAMALRQQGFAGSILIVGAEAELPYARPPLSKEYLAGATEWERLPFRSAEAWAERQVELRLGIRVVGVDAGAHRVTTDGGDTLGYGSLIWAAGGTARRLNCAGHDLAGVHTIRTRADVDQLIAELPGVQRAVVVGGGYIGLEAAAVLTKLGKQVTLVEALDRVLARVAAEPLSRFYEAQHREQGVELCLDASVDHIMGRDGRAAGVRLADGREIAGEMVIVGIGIDAAVEPLQEAGAKMGNGVRVDGQCRTSLPDVYAIGDCAEHHSDFAGGEWIRLESVQNAVDQAGIAAKAICGSAETYNAVPWFWSNQFDLRLQTVGISRGHDDLVVRGDMAARGFSIVYLRGGRVVALDCVNATRDYVQGKALVAAGSRAAREQLADPALPLKQILAQAADV